MNSASPFSRVGLTSSDVDRTPAMLLTQRVKGSLRCSLDDVLIDALSEQGVGDQLRATLLELAASDPGRRHCGIVHVILKAV